MSTLVPNSKGEAVFLLVILAMLCFSAWGLLSIASREAACRERGGVSVAQACLKKEALQP